jgi:alkylhydroperoxidase/carboxymuconolactone decarboxylase family protein YurZ
MHDKHAEALIGSLGIEKFLENTGMTKDELKGILSFLMAGRGNNQQNIALLIDQIINLKMVEEARK